MDGKDWRVMQFLAPRFKANYNAEKGEYCIMGEAIHATTTRNGTIFTVEELQGKAHTLVGKPLLIDHNNSVHSIAGRVTAAKWDAGRNAVVFKAKVTDKAMQEKITCGDVANVSVGAMVDDVEEIESDGKYTYLLKGIEFLELSLVAIPADPAAGFGIAQAVQAAFKAKKSVAAQTPITNTATSSKTFIVGDAYATRASTSYTSTSTMTTSPSTQEPATEPVAVEEKNREESTTMENSNPNEALAQTLSKISESLTAVAERLGTVEQKLAAPAAPAPVAEDKKPETQGRVSAAAETETVAGQYIFERHGTKGSLAFASYDKSQFPNLGNGRVAPMRVD